MIGTICGTGGRPNWVVSTTWVARKPRPTSTSGIRIAAMMPPVELPFAEPSLPFPASGSLTSLSSAEATLVLVGVIRVVEAVSGRVAAVGSATDAVDASVGIGAGFGAAELTGEENADEMRTGNNGTRFLSNHAGGVLGGISTGQPVVVRFAVKPTSSILTTRRTVDRKGADTDILTKGRHDPCVGIRAVPVGEAMMACVLADHFLRDRGQTGR